MEPSLLLTYILIVFSLIIGTLLSIVLCRLARILEKVEETVNYIDHVRGLLETWEQIPFNLIRKVISYLSK